MNIVDIIWSFGALCDCEECLVYTRSGSDFPYMTCCDVADDMYELAVDMILESIAEECH